MFIRTTPRFLSAGLMVRVSLACWSLVSAVCCEGVRLDGSCLHIRGRLSVSSCLVCSIYISSFPTPVYLSKGVSVWGLGRNFMCL